jgi:hypothetical protein
MIGLDTNILALLNSRMNLQDSESACIVFSYWFIGRDFSLYQATCPA